MKFNFKGIRFSTWLYFFGFSISILLMLGLLLVTFIKPYYRNDRIKTIDVISNTIETLLVQDKASSTDLDRISRTVVGNNVCAIVYNEQGESVYMPPDSLGGLCMLDKPVTIREDTYTISQNPEKFLELIRMENPYSTTVISDYNNIDMLLYGKKIKTNLSNYYIILNTPLEPVESYIDFILNQYIYLAIIVVAIAVIVSFFMARRISSPIVKMKNEANKLAQGDYDVKFELDSYSEINDLALTLDDATHKLSQINDLRKDLVANVSHDIKTPLTMIKAYAEMIRDLSGDDPVKRNEHLEVILKEADYLDKLVTDMSELSKLQSGIIELNLDNFDLRECILSITDLMESLLVSKNITLKTDLDDSVVYADEIKISQVIYNFVSNSIKYSKENSTITITLRSDEEKAVVMVKDEGDGISEEALPYVWDRYYKVDKNFNRTIKSTGLGLAISKAILEAHKAKYGVKSKEGEGSTFYFELSRDYDEDGKED